jgi:hypothetical protein
MAADVNVLSTQLTLGLIGAGLLQWLKSQPWLAKINQHSSKINHAVLLVTSALGGLGIHYAWSSAEHSLTISGLDAAAIVAALWLWAKQWSVQFLVHRGAFGAVANAPSPASSVKTDNPSLTDSANTVAAAPKLP